MPNPFRLISLDPDPLVLEQMSRIAQELRVDFEGHAGGRTFLESIDLDSPACITTECELLDGNGVDVQRHLRRAGLRWPVIFYVHAPELADVVEAVRGGAVDVIAKTAPERHLVLTLERALLQMTRLTRVDASHRDSQQRLLQLTPKEHAVLDLILEGFANKVIAKRLGISLRTVEVRRHRIFHKTGSRSVAELVRLVLTAQTLVSGASPTSIANGKT